MKKINKQKSVLRKRFLTLPIISIIFISFALIQTQALIPNTDNTFKNLSSFQSMEVKNKNQQINGPCWAFANIATLETFLNKKGMLKGSLSEKHLLSWANQGSYSSGWCIPIEHGGNCKIANGYMTCGCGPVLEKDCPYDTKNTRFDTISPSAEAQYLVKGIKKVKSDTNSIKEAIAAYGAVTATYSVNDKFNHCVSIVGWDDSNNNWLVKDSAKIPFNYTWLSFNEELKYCYCITDASELEQGQKIYQHDPYGVCGNYNSDKKIIAANVFDFKGDEKLDSIMIYSDSTNAKLNLYCAPVLSDGTPNSNMSTWQNLYNGVIPYEGYSTFKLNNKINLSQGKYAIIVKIEKNFNSGEPSLGCQMPTENLNLDFEQKNCKSYIMLNNSFIDISNTEFNNISAFSIKAITTK